MGQKPPSSLKFPAASEPASNWPTVPMTVKLLPLLAPPPPPILNQSMFNFWAVAREAEASVASTIKNRMAPGRTRLGPCFTMNRKELARLVILASGPCPQRARQHHCWLNRLGEAFHSQAFRQD